MSSLLSALPVHALSPVLRPVQGALAKMNTAARPLREAVLLTAVLAFFKPVARVLLHLGLALVSSKPASSTRPVRRTELNIAMLNHMASELEIQQPHLAAELRLLAAQN